jgi:hypothetical protein
VKSREGQLGVLKRLRNPKDTESRRHMYREVAALKTLEDIDDVLKLEKAFKKWPFTLSVKKLKNSASGQPRD